MPSRKSGAAPKSASKSPVKRSQSRSRKSAPASTSKRGRSSSRGRAPASSPKRSRKGSGSSLKRGGSTKKKSPARGRPQSRGRNRSRSRSRSATPSKPHTPVARQRSKNKKSPSKSPKAESHHQDEKSHHVTARPPTPSSIVQRKASALLKPFSTSPSRQRYSLRNGGSETPKSGVAHAASGVASTILAKAKSLSPLTSTKKAARRWRWLPRPSMPRWLRLQDIPIILLILGVFICVSTVFFLYIPLGQDTAKYLQGIWKALKWPGVGKKT